MRSSPQVASKLRVTVSNSSVKRLSWAKERRSSSHRPAIHFDGVHLPHPGLTYYVRVGPFTESHDLNRTVDHSSTRIGHWQLTETISNRSVRH